MVRLEMEGPFALDAKTIDQKVLKTSAGNYALGYVKNKIFYFRYVGRSDDDVKSRLKQHISEDYSSFIFSYANSPMAAFERECKNYHDFGGSEKLDNKIHPDRPCGHEYLSCPCCNKLDY